MSRYNKFGDYVDSQNESFTIRFEKIESIFNEDFDALPEFRKYSRCDYANICDAKEDTS